MHKRSVIAILTALLLSTGMVFAQAAGSGNPHNQGSLAVPVAGTFSPLSTAGQFTSLGSGTMAGTLNVKAFAVQNNAAGQPQLVAIGNLVATLTNAAGQATTVVLNNVTAAVTPSGTCPILTLTLGPLDLNILGLDINIPNPVNLNIVAQSGPGNLLGNLLCDVTGLLNNNSALSQIAAALNQVLAGLGL